LLGLRGELLVSLGKLSFLVDRAQGCLVILLLRGILFRTGSWLDVNNRRLDWLGRLDRRRLDGVLDDLPSCRKERAAAEASQLGERQLVV